MAAAREPERIEEGVWLVRGGIPRNMNVYLIQDGDGVVVFDAGISGMGPQIRAAAQPLGGINKVVLGHAHPDHRGAAPELGAPVLCHPDERAYAESEHGQDYFDLSSLPIPARYVYPKLLRHWDGGPVAISGTVEEGDEIAGFRVVHLPGHAPGLIALFREADGVALTSDAFYTLDPRTGLKGAPRLPLAAFNQDEQATRASVLKLAALNPVAAWPGHAEPLRGNVPARLETVARG